MYFTWICIRINFLHSIIIFYINSALLAWVALMRCDWLSWKYAISHHTIFNQETTWICILDVFKYDGKFLYSFLGGVNKYLKCHTMLSTRNCTTIIGVLLSRHWKFTSAQSWAQVMQILRLEWVKTTFCNLFILTHNRHENSAKKHTLQYIWPIEICSALLRS